MDFATYPKNEELDWKGRGKVFIFRRSRRFPKLDLIFRIFWAFALVLCAAGCLRMILEIKAKQETTPVIVSFADRPTNIWQIPFPAVTVCPTTKVRQTVFRSSKYFDDISGSSALTKDFAKWVKEFKPSKGPNQHNLDDFDYDEESLLLGNSTIRNSM